MTTAAPGLRFAYSTINWGTTPEFDPVFSDIRGAGWGAVELFWHDLGWLGPVDGMRAALARHGLRPATLFGLVKMPTDPAQLVRMKHEISYAADLGAAHYGLVGGDRLRWRPPSREEIASLARFCDDLAAHGAAIGVDVAYHPHVACTIETEEEIDRFLDGSRIVTLCLDASHIALVGEDPLAHLAKYRDRTSYIHLKDWARGKFVEMGEGSLGIDFAAILRDLASVDFPGWVVVEQSRSDIAPRHSAEINAAFLRSLGYDPGAAG